MSESELFRVRVKSITWLAIEVHGVVLETLDGWPLPPAGAGSHIDVKLDAKTTRSYSVVGNSDVPTRYEIAVAKDAKSRGGSRYVHETLRVGDVIQISAPRNLFPLVEEQGTSLMIAGGIGITPIWAMVQRLETLGRPWMLLYASRSRGHAAYLQEIEALAARSSTGRLLTHLDDEHRGSPPDIAAVLTETSPQAHLYCCGPQPMLAAFEKATASWPSSHVHLECFAPVQTAKDSGAFRVVLNRSGQEFTIPPNKTILDVLLENGVNAQYGCMQGACGSCETPVIEGIPEHLDTLLSAQAKASNQSMLICCSRSKTATLTLDI